MIILTKMIRKNPVIHVTFTEENSTGSWLKTVQGKLFPVLDKLEHIRSSHGIFNSNVPIHTIDTWDNSILAFVRENDEEKFIGIYNFSENDKVAWINEEDGMYTDLISGREMEAKGVQIPAFGCYWLCRNKQ